MRTILFVVAAMVATTAAEGQVRVVRYGDDRLVGIREVDVVVTTEDAGAPCAADRAALQATAVVPLRQAGLRATTSDKAPSWYYSVVIHVVGHPTGPSCAVAISSELVAEVEGVPEADRSLAPGAWGSLLVGGMPLVRVTDLVSAPRGEHHAAAAAALTAQVAAIAARIRAVNP